MRTILTGATHHPGPSDEEQFAGQAADSLQHAQANDPFADKQYEGYFISITFLSRFQADRFSIDTLRRAAENASVDYRGWPFLLYHPDRNAPVVTNDSLRTIAAWHPREKIESYDFWELRRSGLLVQKKLLFEDGAGYADQDGHRVIDPINVAYYATEAVDALVPLYGALGVQNEEITWRVSLTGAQGRSLRAIGRIGLFSQSYVAQVPTIEYQQRHALEEWSAGLKAFAVETTREILLRFQWTDPSMAMLEDWSTSTGFWKCSCR